MMVDNYKEIYSLVLGLKCLKISLRIEADE